MVALRTILVPIDFSETSSRALDFARMLADKCGASLHLLHVIGGPPASSGTGTDEQRDACARLDALLDDADREARHATTSCGVGTFPAEIIRYATDHAIDLIVMGAHTHGPAFRMCAPSIAECVLWSAPCAVLAVKGGPKDARDTGIDPVPGVASP